MPRIRSVALLVGCALLATLGCGDEKKDSAPVVEEDPDAPPPDLCEPRSGEVCSTFPQCGCGANQNCNIVTASGRTACVAVGAGALHTACVNAGECQKGLQCFGGVCVPLCIDDNTDCTIDHTPRCKRVTFTPPITPDDTPDAAPMDARPVPIEVPGFGVCLAQCDPMKPATVCGEGRSCVFFSLTDATTQCISPGTATGAGGCAKSVLACAVGYGCFDGDCRKICRVGVAEDCPGATCAAFAEPVTKNGTQYGTCK
jgi:hypothetical protein